jgi:hypothetical protein
VGALLPLVLAVGLAPQRYLELVDSFWRGETGALLSFVPEDSRAGWHELKVKLRSARGEVRARRGYYRRPAS